MKRREIYAINPSKRKKTRKRKAKPMAKKRRKAVKRKRTYRRNPAKRRKTRSKARSIARRSFMGLSFKKALGNVPATQIGMFAAKAAAKLFGAEASETDPTSWDWASYLKAAGGGIGAGILANMVKPGTGQKVLEGSLNYIVFKALQNELISKNDWASQHLGDDDYSPDEYLLTGADENWFLGADGNAYPTDEMYRLPEASYGEVLQPPGPLGDVLVAPGPLGSVADNYRREYFHQV